MVKYQKAITILVFIVIILISYTLAFAESNIDHNALQEIQKPLKSIADSINDGDTQNIINLISPNAAPDLKNEIEDKLAGGSITFGEHLTSCYYLPDNKIKAEGIFGAKGIGWEVTGLSNYFVFENVNGEWLLYETDFHKKLGSEYVMKFVGIIFAILAPFGIFWLWMLIDCAIKPIEGKTAWILMIIFLSILGAILYFLIPRRKYLKEQKLASANINTNEF